MQKGFELCKCEKKSINDIGISHVFVTLCSCYCLKSSRLLYDIIFKTDDFTQVLFS